MRLLGKCKKFCRRGIKWEMCHLPNSPLPNVPFRRMCILEECKKNSRKSWKVCHLPKVPFTKCFIYQMCLLTKCSVAFTKCTFFETPFRDIWKSILPPAENMRNLPFAKCDISRMCLLKLCLLKTVKKNSTSAENVRNMHFYRMCIFNVPFRKVETFPPSATNVGNVPFTKCATYQMCLLPSRPFRKIRKFYFFRLRRKMWEMRHLPIVPFK